MFYLSFLVTMHMYAKICGLGLIALNLQPNCEIPRVLHHNERELYIYFSLHTHNERYR